MSPRSEEFAEKARGRLAAARHALDAGDADVAVGAAYYAMLYAARAALSERDLHAKTHSGTWSLFHEHLVAAGPVAAETAGVARSIEALRLQLDYEAGDVGPEEASQVLGDADRFVEEVLGVLD